MRLYAWLLRLLERSEGMLERVIFHNRAAVLVLLAMASLGLGYQASQMRPDASFLKMIPAEHPYVLNYLKHRDSLSGLGNAVRVVVSVQDGDIFSEGFQDRFKQVSDELFFIPGVDRAGLKSIWTPNVRWQEVTEDGFAGGPVIPADYDGSEASLAQLRRNVLRSGQVGKLVAQDFRSAMVYVPLLDINPDTGERLDFQSFSRALEERVRERFQSDQVSIHITGFAKVVGDLIEGAVQVALFFLLAILITAGMLYAYARSLRGMLVPLVAALAAVTWQLGVLNLLGFGLDPYSMLVPFLVFAISVSHGLQTLNGVAQEQASGVDRLSAARRAFRLLFIPGLVALLSDGIGFLTLMVIDIQVIQELALTASVGVAAIILANLVLLPLLLSYLGAGKLAERAAGGGLQGLWRPVTRVATPAGSRVAIGVAILLLLIGGLGGRDLRIGDLDSGAPELRPDSRYNQDNAYITSHYSASSDIFVVMAETAAESCAQFDNLAMIDRFQGFMQNVPGVQSSISLADVARLTIAGMNEGSLKWRTVAPNQFLINSSLNFVPPGMMNADCSLVPVILFLDDHKAQTLDAVVGAVEEFQAREAASGVSFSLAAGNSGIEAATNQVIATAQYQMLAWVYGVVALLCLLTFRSLATVACILLPLGLTSLLCQALMAQLGIGVKVATLPVIALGVGIGVDYGIYIYSKLEAYLSEGFELLEAYRLTLQSTGKTVAFTGMTLAAGVIVWLGSPIKFQADMGVLLTFMFLWNMLGALLLLPALVGVLKGRRLPGAISKISSHDKAMDTKEVCGATR